LGVHVNQIILMYIGSELNDHQQLTDVLKESSSEHVTAIIKPCYAQPEEYDKYVVRPKDDEDERYGGSIYTYAACVAKGIKFPKSEGININMMPFVIGDLDSLPVEYQHYWPLIEACDIETEEDGKIGFLTIQDSIVEAGASQRRPGLHVEAPRVVLQNHGEMVEGFHRWGWSLGPRKLGGLYMGSNISQSTRICNCALQPPEPVTGILGDVEHLRDVLGEGTLMKSGELWWLTDTTPHESLPLEESAYRQYFRVVTSGVSLWYAKHSTANPLGVQPDPAVTKTVTHDKFIQLADIGSEAEEAADLEDRDC